MPPNRCRAIGGSSRRPHIVTASTVSRVTKSARSSRNSPPYSARAASGSLSYASSMIAGSMPGFIAAVFAFQTRTRAPSLPKCRRYALYSSPRLRTASVPATACAPGIDRQAGPQRAQDFNVWVGAGFVLPPKRDLVAQARDQGISARGSEARRADLDHRAVGQCDRFGVFVKDHRRQHGDGLQ